MVADILSKRGKKPRRAQASAAENDGAGSDVNGNICDLWPEERGEGASGPF